MPCVPPEVLEEIFSELPRRDLLSVALTSRLCHYISLTLLYRQIQRIQLFGWGKQAHIPSIKCLETLASPGGGPRAVRHFATRGLPWVQDVTMRSLSQALVNMNGLVSLELEMGALPETLLFTESHCVSPAFLPHLRAVSLHDSSTVGPLLMGRPVEYLRLRTMINPAAFSELLTDLQWASVPLKCLQVWIAVPDVASAAAIVDKATCRIPSLTSLGITFTLPSPRWTERLSAVIEEIIDPLTSLRSLTELSLAIIPDIQLSRDGDLNLTGLKACLDAIHRHLPHLRLVELQWEARELRDGVLHLLPKHHRLMRRTWRYPHANIL